MCGWFYLPFLMFVVLVDFILVFLEANAGTHISTCSTLKRRRSAGGTYRHVGSAVQINRQHCTRQTVRRLGGKKL